MNGSTMVLKPPSILGKRNRASSQYLLRLTASPELTDSDLERPVASTSKLFPPVLINGTLVSHTKKRYKCTHEGCDKAYSKPSRLEEHERSHSGQVLDFSTLRVHSRRNLFSAPSFVKNAPSRTYAKPILLPTPALTCRIPTGLSSVLRRIVKRDFGLHNICACMLLGTMVQSPLS
jgi:hypothetical protein